MRLDVDRFQRRNQVKLSLLDLPFLPEDVRDLAPGPPAAARTYVIRPNERWGFRARSRARYPPDERRGAGREGPDMGMGIDGARRARSRCSGRRRPTTPRPCRSRSASPPARVDVSADAVRRDLFAAADAARLARPDATTDVVLERLLAELYARNPGLSADDAVAAIGDLRDAATLPDATELEADGANGRIERVLAALAATHPTGARRCRARGASPPTRWRRRTRRCPRGRSPSAATSTP